MDTIYVMLLITAFVLGVVVTGLWPGGYSLLDRGTEAYIFKLVAIGLIVFFFIAITFGLLPDPAHFRL